MSTKTSVTAEKPSDNNETIPLLVSLWTIATLLYGAISYVTTRHFNPEGYVAGMVFPLVTIAGSFLVGVVTTLIVLYPVMRRLEGKE